MLNIFGMGKHPFNYTVNNGYNISSMDIADCTQHSMGEYSLLPGAYEF
jgi:hypothetical protein